MNDDRDHRYVGQRLDLFHFREEAPGMVFWHPRGHALYRALEEAVRAQCRAHGYEEVKTPQIMRRSVWEKSGHWSHFFHGMFHVQDQAVDAAVKPVSCPGHIYVAMRRPPSYQELPLRYCELGTVHRDEASGTLQGLLRVRQFTQDDGHVVCMEEQVEAEIERFCRAVEPFYRAFGFLDGVSVALSSRPKDSAGDDSTWRVAEDTLRRVLARLEVPFVEQPGQGAFYGPKLEFSLRDRHGRSWQCGTIQVDLVMPKRFGLEYVGADGKRRTPVLLHRALYGSLERFLGILLEHHGARLPAWLAPVQVVVLPVTKAGTKEGSSYGHSIAARLRASNVRTVMLDEGSLARRVVEAHDLAAPWVLVVGAREEKAGTVTIRDGALSREVGGEALVAEVLAKAAAPVFA